MSKFLISAAVVSSLVFASSAAMADTSKGVESFDEEDGYGYKFDDDLVGAGVTGPNSALIKIRQGVVRRTLIRPRTNFVPEMLKSIELI
jgi:hypothetical protein